MAVGSFTFEDQIRASAGPAVHVLDQMRLPVRLLSGDAEAPVAIAARDAGIALALHSLTPDQKVADVQQGKTLMVGDGINDAPALRAAYASMAPSTAADIGRTAADFVITGGDLTAVPFAIRTARSAARIVVENLTIAIGYNAIAVPLAVSGHVTPLIAAVAMSSSSILVVLNAMKLRWSTRSPKAEASALPVLEERAA